MLNRSTSPCLTALFVGACLFTPALLVAQEPPLAPGPQHAELKRLAGDWTFVMKMSDGTKSEGTAHYKMAVGGFWLLSDFETNFAGIPFHGHGMDGYDLRKKKYISVWVDNMSTAPMTFEGEEDPKTHHIVLRGEGPGNDGKPATWRSVTKVQDADHFSFDMYVKPQGGEETLMFTLEYKRKK